MPFHPTEWVCQCDRNHRSKQSGMGVSMLAECYSQCVGIHNFLVPLIGIPQYPLITRVNGLYFSCHARLPEGHARTGILIILWVMFCKLLVFNVLLNITPAPACILKLLSEFMFFTKFFNAERQCLLFCFFKEYFV